MKIKNILYIILGFIFLAIGIVGAFMPVLPTTPFVMLAAFLFARGSKKFHDKLVNSNFYKKYATDYVKTRSMTKTNKMKILLTATIMLLISAYFFDNLHFRIFVGVLILIKYYYFIFKIKTIDDKDSLYTKKRAEE